MWRLHVGVGVVMEKVDGDEEVGGEAGKVGKGTSLKSGAGYMEREEPEALEELGRFEAHGAHPFPILSAKFGSRLLRQQPRISFCQQSGR